jgi:GT2 family glycosyltransferase
MNNLRSTYTQNNGETANVCAVVVTFNRRELLEQTLLSYEEQTCQFSALIIVDNASTDGTKAFLDTYETKHHGKFKTYVFHLPKNSGGAGGNAFGIQKAIELTDCRWIFISDDDAFLASDMLDQFVSYETQHKQMNVVAYASAVYHGTQLELEQRSRINRTPLRIKRTWVPSSEYQKPSFDFDLLTFVGAFISRLAVEKVGYPDPGFFIHYDDTEYSCRLRKNGRIICLPACHVDHRDAFGSPLKITWRTFYDIRNRGYTIRKHFGLWYYWVFKLRTRLLSTGLYARLVKRYSPATIAMTKRALSAAGHSKLNVDEIYNPNNHEEF